MSEEDYNRFLEGGADAEEMIKKYLSKEEAEQLESWDKEEVSGLYPGLMTEISPYVSRFTARLRLLPQTYGFFGISQLILSFSVLLIDLRRFYIDL